jgi:hypothetical protein
MNTTTKLTFLLLLISVFNSQAQVFDHPEVIKNKKCTKLFASKAFIYSDSTVNNEKASYWEFNSVGQEVLEIDFEINGDTSLIISTTYEDGKINQIRKDKKHLNEIELIDYKYNEKGNLTDRIETRNGKPVISYKYYYGDNSQLDSVLWLGVNGKVQLSEYYTYESGRLTEISEKTGYGRLDGRTEIDYHEDGTLKEEKLYDGFGDLFEHLNYSKEGWMTKKVVFIDEKKTIYTFEYKGNGLMKESKKTYSDNPDLIEEMKFKWKK